MANFLKKFATISTMIAALAITAVAPVAQATTYAVPEISGDSITPNPFNPYVENATVEYYINYASNVRVDIYNSSNTSIATLINDYQDFGWHSVVWDGSNYSGSQTWAPEGTYRYEIYVYNDAGFSDTATGSFEIDYDNNGGGGSNNHGPDITNLRVTPPTFNPDREDAQIRFTIDESADVEVTVENRYGDVIETILDEFKQDGTYTYYWDGRDDRNRDAAEGTYEVHVYASNAYGSDEEQDDVRVDYGTYPGPNPYPYPYPQPYPQPYPGPSYGCAGFVDIAPGSELCDAAKFVREMGIFEGYRDGTFRPEQPINRVEVTKVLVEAFNIDVMAPNRTNLGFLDLDPFAWYMPFIRTAKRYGIIQGYPDHTFRPTNTMNRAELVKTFLTTSGIAMPTCIGEPYADTPNNPITGWYIDFACFSKAHNLISSVNGFFAPEKPVTRGEVAIMFYRFDRQGLFARSVTPPIDAR